MLNDLGTEYHVKLVVLKWPAPVQVAVENFNAASFSLGCQRRSAFHAVKFTRTFLQVPKQQAPIAATHIDQTVRRQFNHGLSAPIIAPFYAQRPLTISVAVQQPENYIFGHVVS
jgi:hypothetical protein